MTTFNHALGARARHRNFILLGALVATLFVRGLRWLGRLEASSTPQRRRDAPARRAPAAQRAAEAAYWVDASLHAWPRGGLLRRPDAV